MTNGTRSYKGKVMRIALGGFLGWIGHSEGRKSLSTLLRALSMINGTRPYKRIITRRLNLALCVLCFMSFSLTAGAEPPEHAPGVIIVKFHSDDRDSIYDFVHRSGAHLTERAFPGVRAAQTPQRLSAVYKLKFSPDADVASMARNFGKDPLVEYAQPNYIKRPCSEISGELNDFFYEDQWALRAIDALDAWKIEKGSSDVIIAIVDSGVDYNHEDLKPRIWINPGEIDGNGLDDDENGYVDDIRGWDFVDSPYLPADVDQLDRDNDPMDENGHGTHVSGIAAAVPNNSKGIAGITWNCRIMALRGGGDFFEDDDLSAAIVYAADNGAHVINMSWGGEELSYIIRDALEYAYDRGCVLVGAAGNDDRPAVIYPAIHKNVIAVGATDKFDRKAHFSNYGPGLDIVAPGHRVFGTTLGNRYSDWSGTSMAAPVVSGVVALMLSRRPGLTNDEVAQILRFSADEVDDPLLEGIGRVNAANALAVASSPVIARITSPDSGTGANTTLTIRGTAAGSRFLSFQLEYGAIPDMNWTPICHSRNAPIFDSPLEVWDLAHLDEGTYVLRLRVFGDGNLKVEDRVVLSIDHSPPEITELRIVPGYAGENYRYAVKWRTDEPTFGEVYYRENGSEIDFERLTSLSTTDEHAIYTEIDPGNYECFVAATNAAGLTTIDDNNGDYYPLEIQMLKVTSDGFLKTAVDVAALHPVSGKVDFDGDGRAEIVGMKVQWLYDIVKVYERNESGGYDEVFASDADYFPWEIADTDSDGLLEILGNKKDLTFLYESPLPGSYPTEKIWEVEGAWGGRIADLDLDGRKEVVARYLDSDEIRIYENRGDNSYLKVARLQNPTVEHAASLFEEGSSYLSTTFATADFDGDGRIEIAVGDWSGDVFIYENTGDDRYSHTWTGGVPHSQVRFVEAGDFDGDGMDEFIVGARAEEPYGSIRRRWVYTLFDCRDQNQYEAVWSREIMGEKGSAGAVSAGDIDSDSRDEIFIIVTPSLYIFKVLDTGTSLSGEWEVEPVWHHSADNTKWPIMEDLDANGVNEILFNDGDKLTVFEWNEADSIPIHRPWGLSARPLSETEVEIHWNGPSEVQTYRIYRGMDAENLQPVASMVTRGYFRDSGLENGVTYWYSVASVNASGQESETSDEVSATPNSPPKLMSAEYVSPFKISLTFNEPMGPSAQNEAEYMVISDGGLRRSVSSAILNSQGMKILLTLERTSSEGDMPQGLYTATVSDIRDASGVAISADGNSTMFHVPGPDVHIWSDLSHIVVYPNPIMPSSRHPGRMTFGNLPPDTTIRIYDCSGQLVRNLGEGESTGSRIIWYLDNDDHWQVTSGTYIYIAEWKDNIRMGKVAVIR